MNSIIYKEDIDDDSNNKIRNIIDEAINSKDEGSANANIEENHNSTADSLVSALKGNI